MGCGGSSKVANDVAGPPSSEEDKTNEEMSQLRRTFDKHALHSAGKFGTIDESAFEKFYEEVCGAPLEPDEKAEALKLMRQDGAASPDGEISFDVFLR